MRLRSLFACCVLSLIALLPGAAWGQGPAKQPTPDTGYLRTIAQTRGFMRFVGSHCHTSQRYFAQGAMLSPFRSAARVRASLPT